MTWLSFIKPQVLTIFHSKVNSDIRVVESFGKRTIWVKGAEQSGGTIVSMWGNAIKKLKDRQIKNCLVLGVGGGTVMKIIKSKFPSIQIVGVEIDPVMIDAAREYFSLEALPNFTLVLADVFPWLKKTEGNLSFDLIIVDLFVGKYNPKKAREGSFLLTVKNLLSPAGFILYNSHYQKENPQEFEAFFQKCRAIYTSAEIILKYPYSRIVMLK